MRYVAVFIAALSLIPLPASASANFSISPLGIGLTSSGSNATITITNRSNTALRIQATPYAWSQTETNDMVLKPTKQLVVYPTVFTVEPGQARKLRVGTTVPSEATQLAYRLVLEQLPSLQAALAPKGQDAVDLRTRLTVPVVLRPSAPPTRSIAIQSATVSKSAVDVVLTNPGNAHAEVSTIRVHGIGQGGKSLFDKTGNAWYVLAGATRKFTIPVPAGHCADVKAVSIDVTGTNIPEVKKTLNATGACSS